MTQESSSYSANVDMYLLFDSQKLPLGQLGPAHCILEQATSCPPGEGEIVLIIDGHESHIPVYFPDGMPPNQTRVTYQTLVPTEHPSTPDL